MMIEDATVWVSLVSDFGYPFVVSMFLLFRFGKKLNELTLEVENLKKTGHKKRSWHKELGWKTDFGFRFFKESKI